MNKKNVFAHIEISGGVWIYTYSQNDNLIKNWGGNNQTVSIGRASVVSEYRDLHRRYPIL